MTRYGQYCPITRAIELLGDRWTFLVIRDLLVGATRFNELARGLPGCRGRCCPSGSTTWSGTA
ncbi:helix-turn-helix domain-containing protein [Pseudonocardia sp. C8]|uniref:winged helix-turn-helix transcriptional regulator n=1 Tax=Pseudonocardia sp. C8 TaxID=2762759 RepID=UPI001C93010A|nr:helix-turn-helix domain-containing protein [Pseudonocardia sp. C8]